MVSQPTTINLFFLKEIWNLEDISSDGVLLTNAELVMLVYSLD